MKTLLILFCCLPFTLYAQLGSTGAALNQIHPDPAEAEVKNEVDDLRKTVNDLDKPTPRKNPRDTKEQSREKQLPSQKRQQAL